MNESRHTPGPWEMSVFNNAVSGREDWDVCEAGGGDMVCELAGLQNAHANARLIAAAPDLLELAEAVISIGAVLPDDTEERPSVIFGHPTPADWAELFLTAKAAILKAKGEK